MGTTTRTSASLMRAVLAAIVILFALPAGAALAYCPSCAANYADEWANDYNPFWPRITDDCTNFVSQAVFAGRYPMTGVGGSLSDDHNWYASSVYTGWRWTHSWSFSQGFRNFLIYDRPGGSPMAIRPGSSPLADSTVGTGDVLFYDWDPNHPDGGSEPWDHATIVTGYGNTADGKYGDYVDGHTSARYHDFWTLKTYNLRWRTTLISPVHIDVNN